MRPTIATVLQQAVQTLRATSSSARLDAEVLLATLLREPRSYLLTHPEQGVPVDVLSRFQKNLQQRAAGLPVAQITGFKEFWSLELEVTPEVLVPRPETELLVETALDLLAERSAPTLLDLGTGSGAIALSLASELPAADILGIDSSQAALAVARRNAARLKLTTVAFLCGNWYQPAGTRRFDLIVSNPPYIAADDPALLTPELKAEPRGALTPGPSGLEALEYIALHASRYLNRGGWLTVEHGATQGAAVADLFSRAAFSNIRGLKDLAGRDRVTIGMK